nr:hypothetical protein [Tanacetum cinerariifolium]
MNIVLGKGKDNPSPPKGFQKKKSIFWVLPYWENLQVRHCLDVMHIEKNVCESLIGLLLNIAGKTKDGVNVQNDMEDMGIRPELAAKVIPGKRGSIRLFCQHKEVSVDEGLEVIWNRSRPEGSIVKGYAAEEVIKFDTNYLRDVRNVSIPQSRHKGRLGGV